MPSISSKSGDVLKVIQQRGSVTGAELRHALEMGTTKELIEAVQPLIEQNLIAASGHALEEDWAPFASFKVMPSAVPFVRSYVGLLGNKSS